MPSGPVFGSTNARHPSPAGLDRNQEDASFVRVARFVNLDSVPWAAPVLDAEASAACSRLTAEIASIGSVGAVIKWVRRNIGAKNTLKAEDAGAVESAFRDRMELLESQSPGPRGIDRQRDCRNVRDRLAWSINRFRSPPWGRRQLSLRNPEAISGENHTTRGDKSVLTIAEPRRYRNKKHLRFVVQPCLVCERTQSDRHHLRFMQPRALGRRKISDEFVAPLCRTHHREVHRVGDDVRGGNRPAFDPIKIARQLWKKTRLNERATRHKSAAEPTGSAVSGSNSTNAPASDDR
jgi:hypothetical protein